MTTTYTGELEATPCCVCGITFGVPSRYLQEIRDTGGSLHCPNGHTLTWKDSAGNAKKQLERQLAAERAAHDQTKANRDFWRRQDEATTRRLSAARGQVTKIKARVSRGVCPCCNRFFATDKLARHLETKHPDWKKPEAGA